MELNGARLLVAPEGLHVDQHLSEEQFTAARILLDGLCDCDKDLETCALAFCCGPVVQGIIADRIGAGSAAMWMALMCGFMFIGGSAIAGASVLALNAPVADGALLICRASAAAGVLCHIAAPVCIGAYVRGELHHLAGIRTPRCGRYLCLHLCCAPCALTQEYKAAHALRNISALRTLNSAQMVRL